MGQVDRPLDHTRGIGFRPGCRVAVVPARLPLPLMGLGSTRLARQSRGDARNKGVKPSYLIR